MLNPTRRPTDSRSALDAFIEHKRAIDALLAELVQKSDEHFHADPEAVGWSHVAGLDHLRQALENARDSAP
jgi:hypothetical protein